LANTSPITATRRQTISPEEYSIVLSEGLRPSP
jgi:hypothetical protein